MQVWVQLKSAWTCTEPNCGQSTLCTSVTIWVFTVRQNCSGFVSGVFPSRSACFLIARRAGAIHNWCSSAFWSCFTFPHFGRFLCALKGLGFSWGLVGSCLLRSFPQCLSTIIQFSWLIMIEWEVRKDRPKMSFVQRCGTTTAQFNGTIFFWFPRVINGIQSQFNTFPKFKFFDFPWIYCQVDLYRVLQGELLEL